MNIAVIESFDRLKLMANAVRMLAADAVEKAASGHPGMPLGMADVATVLFARHLRFYAHQPNWPDRDRFILSAGHGSMLLYALLHLSGYNDMSLDDIKNFRQWGAKTAGHPEYGHAAGIETTTGPLGQGFANGVGMAIAERKLALRFGEELVNHYTYVIAGDGCLMEGISHEAASLAGHLGLGRLIVLYDDNQISIDGKTDLALSDDALARFAAYGWHTMRIDGHDMKAIDEALQIAKLTKDKPTLIACRTLIGYGAPNSQGTAKCHGAPLGASEIAALRQALEWPYPPFVIPRNISVDWQQVGNRYQGNYVEWQVSVEAHEDKIAFAEAISGKISAQIVHATIEEASRLAASPQKMATRVASQNAIGYFAKSLPLLLGGSADLTGSNNTKVDSMKSLSAKDMKGSYIHYGVREHAMAAIMNGIALHRGYIPYGGTFLVFSDYARPAIRLAALMGLRVIYVMTHDSIGLGEDGPTHQPIEHLAALRAIPNLLVMRPCDEVETLECWLTALIQTNRPTILALSRQALTPQRLSPSSSNQSERGAYVLNEAKGGLKARQITLIASGSEVEIMAKAALELQAQNIACAVISMPCFELFRQQDKAYQQAVLGEAPRLVLEAGIRQGWDEWLRPSDDFIGMNSFGASAPAPVLYQQFGLTCQAVVVKALAMVGKQKTNPL